MTNDYVTVPREPTQEMLIAANSAWFIPDPSPFNKGDEARRAIYKAMIAAAPPAASVRAREIDAFEAGYIQGHDATVEGRYADPSDAAQDYVRTLLVPAVDERAASSEPEMCPNCVTPWKCNGPHEFPQAASSEAAVAWLTWSPSDGWRHYFHDERDARKAERELIENGWLDVQFVPLYTHPAPTTADAGVTDELVDAVYTAINRLGTPISQTTVQAALEAALARAGGK